MKLKYLGTAAAEGWPALFCNCEVCTNARKVGGKELRTRTQTLINDDLLMDFPPDTYMHAVRSGLNFSKVKSVVVTHSHMDHWFPVDMIHRHEHFAHNTPGMLQVYGNEAVEKSYYEAISIDRFKVHPLDEAVKFNLLKPFDKFETNGYTITAIPADHDKRENCLVYLVEKDGKTIFYGHDTGIKMSEEAWAAISAKHLDLITLDCTMGLKRIDGYHMGLADIEEVVERLTKAGAIDDSTVKVINHFSHNGGLNHEQLDAWAKERGMLCAYDEMEVEI
ncbi:Metal-dependent hydrolases of the beta-lactamase superfamily I [Lachnospiraceae bacterium TWA4]|nr:Metal-dependent hydrolases of the beta-lactamase superfamily I [Lachnospiraceae bacterium TWA4]